jgi:hypothetical protein
MFPVLLQGVDFFNRLLLKLNRKRAGTSIEFRRDFLQHNRRKSIERENRHEMTQIHLRLVAESQAEIVAARSAPSRSLGKHGSPGDR